MSKFQRVKSFLAGVALLLLILILLAVPESGLSIVALILSLSLVFYGFRMLWYYAKMDSDIDSLDHDIPDGRFRVLGRYRYSPRA